MPNQECRTTRMRLAGQGWSVDVPKANVLLRPVKRMAWGGRRECTALWWVRRGQGEAGCQLLPNVPVR